MTLNPIFESSARRRMRTIKTPAIITAYTLAMLLFSVSGLIRFFGQGLAVWQVRLSTEWYIWLTALQFLLIALVAPALSAGSISGERERQTFDLLLVTGVGARRIVMGKMLESFAFLALLILCGAPVMALASVTGGMPVIDLAATLLYLLVIAFAALSVGMLASVILRRSLPAIIAAYLMIFAIGAGSWMLARHGPLAANYTYSMLEELARAGGWTALAALPVTVFVNPAIGLVTLLASQTGILHNTMEYTMRLQDIYSVAQLAGFGRVAWASLGVIFAAGVLFTALSIAILYAQTGAIRMRRGKGSPSASEN